MLAHVSETISSGSHFSSSQSEGKESHTYDTTVSKSSIEFASDNSYITQNGDSWHNVNLPLRHKP